jgi:hypothetical protein
MGEWTTSAVAVGLSAMLVSSVWSSVEVEMVSSTAKAPRRFHVSQPASQCAVQDPHSPVSE